LRELEQAATAAELLRLRNALPEIVAVVEAAERFGRAADKAGWVPADAHLHSADQILATCLAALAAKLDAEKQS
jgi:hypothetical protein